MASAQSAMLSGPTTRIFLRFLLPAFGAMAITSLYNIVDTIFIGQAAGEAGLATLGVCLSIFTLINATGVFLGVGGSILFSMAKGRGDEKSRIYFTVSAIAALCIGLIYCAVLNIWLEPILRFIGAGQEIMRLALPYARLLAIVSPILLFNQFIVVFVRNDGAPALAMIAVVSNGLLNILFDYIFVIVLDMGIPGTIWATVVGVSVSIVICFSRSRNKTSGLRFDIKNSTIRILPTIILAGGATFIMDFAPAITSTLFNNMILKYSGSSYESYAAAYSVIGNVVVVFVTIFAAICLACQPLMSINVGIKNFARAKKFFRLGIISIIISSIVLYAAAAIKPDIFIKMFVSSPTEESLRIVPNAVRFYALVLFTSGHNLLIGYYYQSMLQKSRSILISLLRGLVFTVIFVPVFPALWGIDALWFAMPAAEGATLIIALIMWKFFPVKTDKTPQNPEGQDGQQCEQLGQQDEQGGQTGQILVSGGGQT